MEERLQKILSHAGVASRRAAEEIIRAGRVAVDGTVVTELGAKYDAAQHVIAVDGVRIQAEEQKYYILLNKPRGYLSTAHDDRARPPAGFLCAALSRGAAGRRYGGAAPHHERRRDDAGTPSSAL